MAWLAATPKPETPPKRGRPEPDKLSRLDQMKKDGITPQMPPNPAPHITSRLVEIGLVEQNGMGASPISWREINEWQRATGIELPAWEARLLRKLSAEYLAENRAAETEARPAPWRAPRTERDMAAEEARLRMVLD